MKLSQYLLLPINHRQQHLDMGSPCLLHPTPGKVLKMRILREQHLHMAGLENDLPDFKSCHICHLCRNPDCRNYYHTYIGSPGENALDKVNQGTSGKGDSWFNNGFFEVQWNSSMPPLPKDFSQGRLAKVIHKVSVTKSAQGIKNATDGKINIQVKTNEGETLPEGFRWGMTLKRTQVQCPHCSTVGGASNMKRYHFDKCKFKQ